MNKDEVIRELEDDFKYWGARVAVAAATPKFPILAIPWVRALAIWLVGKVLGPIVTEFDLLAYYTYKAKTNLKDATVYQDQMRSYKQAVASGDKNAIEKTKAEKNRQFAILARYNG